MNETTAENNIVLYFKFINKAWRVLSTLKSVGHFVSVLVNSLDIHYNASSCDRVLYSALAATRENWRFVIDVL
jgi:hypothetical protein